SSACSGAPVARAPPAGGRPPRRGGSAASRKPAAPPGSRLRRSAVRGRRSIAGSPWRAGSPGSPESGAPHRPSRGAVRRGSRSARRSLGGEAGANVGELAPERLVLRLEQLVRHSGGLEHGEGVGAPLLRE